ncbi:unknown seed protein USP-like [Vicia villosa]|uniref:unknown seed protein USP-like n=1 Tax=Vicia villosa TaxID=3911 RepID=UPI00273CA244|nr:unknown seed protein USP-like [Vicia villosa]
MEFKNLSVLALFFLAFVGINGSKSGEEYWKSVWPNTTIPKALSDMLQSDIETSMPIKSHEENQYWTIFFEHDLYPGKTMNLGVQKHYESSEYDKKETKKENQPFGFWAWARKETEKENQPFGFWAWSKKETRKEIQPFVALTSDENEAHILNNYCRLPAATGEDKHCALSLESMIDFVISKLGKNIKVMSSSFVQNQDKYVVEEVNKIGDKAVMCHRLNLKKVVLYCHTVNATTTYIVPLVASDGTKSKALTSCHHDTRGMDPSMLKEVLNVEPGTVPVCHFIDNKAIAWVPDMSESGGHSCVI